MSDQDHIDRENRALEALIVAAMRRLRNEECSPDNLPDLTESESNALSGFDAEFIKRVVAGELQEELQASEAETAPEVDDRLALSGSGASGRNRATEVDEVAAKEIDENRRKIIERKKRGDASP